MPLFRRSAHSAFVIGLVGPMTAGRAGAQEVVKNKCEAPVFLDQVCEAGKSVRDQAAEVLTSPVRGATGSAVEMITAWVADGTQWVLGKVVNFIDDSTTPDLTASWFTERYEFTVGLAALVVLPILLLATIRAIMNQDIGQLLRSFFLYLPASIVATFIAITVTSLLLDATDALSAAVADGVAGDVSQIFEGVARTLGGVSAEPTVPSFAMFFGSLFLMIGAFFVWLELLIRSAAVTVSVFFMPLALAGLVWPATSRWTRRLVETLIALILSKFVIVAVISLATAAVADPGRGGFGTVMGGAALMLMAAFSPMVLLKLMPIAEGAALGHLEGVGRKPMDTVRPGGSVGQVTSLMRSKVGRSSSTSVTAASGAALVPAAATAALGATRGATRAGAAPGKKIEKVTDVDAAPERPAGGSVAHPRDDTPGRGERG